MIRKDVEPGFRLRIHSECIWNTTCLASDAYLGEKMNADLAHKRWLVDTTSTTCSSSDAYLDR